jgi:hypothetical protein
LVRVAEVSLLVDARDDLASGLEIRQVATRAALVSRAGYSAAGGSAP